jgi:hypothetical protein
MAADLYPATGLDDDPQPESSFTVQLPSDGYYWHLYWYFESAKLHFNHELIGLYDDNEIFGYELERLEARLKDAALDLQWRPDTWDVTIGWNGKDLRRETELKSQVRKHEMLSLINRLLSLITYAATRNLKLCVRGD